MNVTAIILAEGTGERFGADMPKQFIKLAGKPIIDHTLDVFENNPGIGNIVVVVNKGFIDHLNGLVKEGRYSKVSIMVPGGATRQASSYYGLRACPADTTHVLIHDAARPFIDDQIIVRCLDALERYEAVDVCVTSADTIVEVDDRQDIIAINPLRASTPLRWNNFGQEDARSLLTPDFVALRTLTALASDSIGCVIDIMLTDETAFNHGKN